MVKKGIYVIISIGIIIMLVIGSTYILKYTPLGVNKDPKGTNDDNLFDNSINYANFSIKYPESKIYMADNIELYSSHSEMIDDDPFWVINNQTFYSKNISYIFEKPGKYNITFSTSINNEVYICSKIIDVHERFPEITILKNHNKIYESEEVNLIGELKNNKEGNGIDGNITYLWFIEDDTISGENISYIFEDPGNRSILLNIKYNGININKTLNLKIYSENAYVKDHINFSVLPQKYIHYHDDGFNLSVKILNEGLKDVQINSINKDNMYFNIRTEYIDLHKGLIRLNLTSKSGELINNQTWRTDSEPYLLKSKESMMFNYSFEYVKFYNNKEECWLSYDMIKELYLNYNFIDTHIHLESYYLYGNNTEDHLKNISYYKYEWKHYSELSYEIINNSKIKENIHNHCLNTNYSSIISELNINKYYYAPYRINDTDIYYANIITNNILNNYLNLYYGFKNDNIKLTQNLSYTVNIEEYQNITISGSTISFSNNSEYFTKDYSSSTDFLTKENDTLDDCYFITQSLRYKIIEGPVAGWLLHIEQESIWSNDLVMHMINLKSYRGVS